MHTLESKPAKHVIWSQTIPNNTGGVMISVLECGRSCV
jgi:hypothetical protein